MTTVRQRSITLEEFLRLRERTPALEYIDGEVNQKVSPKAKHGALQLEMGVLIDRHTRPARMARAFTETRATFAGRSLVPDLVVYRWERIQTTANGEIVDDFLEPPDIAVEVISPGQSVTRLQERCRWYVEHGVAIALPIQPRRWTVYRYDPQGGDQALTDADRIDLEDVLPGFTLTVDALFAALRMD